MTVGRVTTGVLVIIGCLWAPLVGSMESVFHYIQIFWGFLSPGIVAAFLFGLFCPKTPPLAAKGALVLGIPMYGLLLWLLPDVAFLHHQMITFLVLALFMALLTIYRPVTHVKTLPESEPNLERARYARWMGGAIVLATALLYAIFW